MIKFFKNKTTGEIKSKSIIIDELIKINGFYNWRDDFSIHWEDYSTHHPLILNCLKTNDDFFEIPTNLILANITNSNIWGNKASCFEAVNYDIINIIERIILRGDYPYNKCVAKEFCNNNNLIYRENFDFLDSIVYCTQEFRAQKEKEKAEKLEEEEMTKNNFIKLDLVQAHLLISKKSKCFVQIHGTSILGSEIKKISEIKMTLRKNGDGFIWMPPRATRKGFNAFIGQYFKQI